MKRNFYLVSYFRNFIFGVEDSLVSTVGLLSGVAIANVSRETIFLTGIILLFVEAFSMAAGSFLSENSAENYMKIRNASFKHDLISGSIMFFSYFISDFIPLLPYLIWNINKALPFSIIFSAIALFILGLIGARISKTGLIKNAFKMVFIGGIAIAVGLIAGSMLSRIGL
jgi:predicted membrane protein (TIGR00267 family)